MTFRTVQESAHVGAGFIRDASRLSGHKSGPRRVNEHGPRTTEVETPMARFGQGTPDRTRMDSRSVR